MLLLRLGVILAGTAFLSSCMVGPNFRLPRSRVEGQWVQKQAVSEHPYGATEVYWWRKFRDPVLNRLIEKAYANNLTLQIAGVRILQARAKLNVAIGNLFPQQQGASGGFNYYYFGGEGPGGLASGGSPVANVVSEILNKSNIQIGPNILTDRLLFSASWEIDFWGKFRREIQSQRASWLASVAAYDDALVTLIADVANAYINLRTLQSRLRVVEENIEIQKESLRIAEVRFTAGETSELDVEQAKTELAKTSAQAPELENGIVQATNALAVLLGVTPAAIGQHLTRRGELPTPPPKIVAGIPHDLLRRRPDVRHAGLQAAAQSPKIGVAVANMLPSFSLTGTFGYSGSNLGNASLTDIFNWQGKVLEAGTSFLFPILNYGRLVNNIRIEDAKFQESVLNYQNTVLKAQAEVENSLSGFWNGNRALAFLKQASASAKETTALALVRYKDGQNDYTTVLVAEQQQLLIENAVVSTHGDVILALIAAYRGLGGGWQLREGGDVIPSEVKEEMARRTNWGRMLKPAWHLPEISPEDEPIEARKNRKQKEANP